MSRPVILVSNDDGINSEGIRALETALAPLGRIYTIAPETEQSAMSHAITLARPVRLRQFGPTRFAIDGTPADCVYVGLHHQDLLPERPSVVVSGINHGLNLGADAFYSGTIAAAREGALRGVPSALAVSLGRGGDFEVAGAIARDLVTGLLARTPTPSETPVLLNLNVPPNPVRGIRATRLGKRVYEDIVEIRVDPRGQHYLWLGGPSTTHHPKLEGTDTEAHDAGYASVTPLTIDLFYAERLELVRTLVQAASNPSTPKEP